MKYIFEQTNPRLHRYHLRLVLGLCACGEAQMVLTGEDASGFDVRMSTFGTDAGAENPDVGAGGEDAMLSEQGILDAACSPKFRRKYYAPL